MASGLELLLASASPRRRQFLNEWGIPFRLALTSADEPRPEQGESPEAYTRRAATAKALASGHAVRQQGAASQELRPVILAADTVVAVDGDILGKPENPAHALRMLERLNGRGHEVISAVCLLLPADAAFAPAQAAGPAGPNVDECCVDSFRMLSFSDTSRVFLHHWPQPVLQAYLDTGEPHDKAGAYAIQGQGAVLVERVDGSWSTVVGLPVTQLAQVMLDRGLMLPCA
ncbi:MAG TPA: Maf family nucleotide pyrophosphatase [Desulfovibrio sp.]|nr:Maf family nucleotide pyrophosphatase [Desulfovibrio sp.]HZF61814.1 Maf family nucleotide pyrophosphatase [Desulfovibrio sp.]